MINPIISNPKVFVCPTCGKIRQMPVVDINSVECAPNETTVVIKIDDNTDVTIDKVYLSVCDPKCKSCNVSMSICDNETLELAQVLAAFGATNIEIWIGQTPFMSRYSGCYDENIYYRIKFELDITKQNNIIHDAIIKSLINENCSMKIYSDPDIFNRPCFYMIDISAYPNMSKNSFIHFCNRFKAGLIEYRSN